MEKVGSWDRKIVINELTQGRDLATELKNQLQPAKSRESCGYLVEKILSSYDNALSLLNCMALLENPSQINGLLGSASPGSSEGSDLIDSKNHVTKERKTLAKWSEQVRLGSGTRLEDPFDDGYNWRKYGQKVILRAKFPRAYYRCTHRNTQGCLATKHVQRTDEDTSLFEVTYTGRHSCIQESLKQKRGNSLMLKNDGGEKKEIQRHERHSCIQESLRQKKGNSLMLKNDGGEKKEIQRHEVHQEMIILKNETQELDTKKEIFSSSEFFSEPVKESNFSASYSFPFLSSATSESYFSRMNNSECHHNLQTSESYFTEIISDPTSVASSTFEDLDFSIDPVIFDPKFLETVEHL
ncbi:unnamed protein product [Fraxinus pennsylvanica]|uniref:WRKY domain-containing protein n=1 Tax=Fraxinus pennsylvanica TaxID=56036 RepID=A0AAD1ZFF4_9LAMI|nr:unnamed protein product [Fraxinus pennsylvanica]